jgi:tRNA (guanine-N7-)-methyltransferase
MHPLLKKEIFLIKENLKKPIYYSSHRIRQSSKKNVIKTLENKTNIKDSLKNNNKNILEIGFGTGSSVIELYKNNKENYYCIESYILGIDNINKFIREQNVKNIYVYHGDAIEIIENNFPDNSLDEILLFFPDPWPKNKHKKRRIINNFSASMFFRKLKKEGLIHFATDHINYAYNTKEIFSNLIKGKVIFNHNRRLRPVTNYEKRGIKRKNFIFDIILKK